MKLKHLIAGLFFAALFFCGCGEKENLTPDPTIEGLWHRHWGNMDFVYEFRETGALTIECVSFGTVLYTNRYAYHVTDNVLSMYDYEEKTSSHFDLAFPTDTTATLDVQRKTGLTMTLVRY